MLLTEYVRKEITSKKRQKDLMQWGDRLLRSKSCKRSGGDIESANGGANNDADIERQYLDYLYSTATKKRALQDMMDKRSGQGYEGEAHKRVGGDKGKIEGDDEEDEEDEETEEEGENRKEAVSSAGNGESTDCED
jgi:hypothetical protein